MFEILYQGVDTLDVAIKGALPQAMIDELEAAKIEAEKMLSDKQGYGVTLGPDNLKLFVKASGKRGGYRYVFIDDPTGAIWSVKANTNPDDWNFFVSARALGLLCKTYEGMKAHMESVLKSLGAQIKEVSVNRIDYAIDIAATDFELDMRNFIAPGVAKLRSYYSTDNELDDNGNRTPKGKQDDIGAVMSGGRFESVTIGKMPGRQVIVYDKLKAAKDLKTPYWFKAWGIDPNDPGTQVWRVEIRGGKDALDRFIHKAQNRTYETIEAILSEFLAKAADDIRYVTNKGEVSNVSRSTVHPLWVAAQAALKALPMREEPALPQAYALEQMRKERVTMAIAQGCGNLNNLLVLEGYAPEEITKHYPQMLAKQAREYSEALGKDLHLEKLAKAKDKLGVFIRHS